MQTQRFLGICLVVSLLLLGASVFAQVTRPTHEGTVWTLSFIHVKPGMNSAYEKYLASDWKKMEDDLKAAGITLSYKVITTEAHSPTDWDLMLMVEYKDMASREANADKADALLQKMFGGDEKVMQGFKDRSEIREVIGTRVAREMILEPKK
jgi:L-rhamnose mutarotase